MTPTYERPESLKAALDLLPKRPWTLLAGGTDVYPAATEAFAWGRAGPAHVLDLTAVDGLSSIEEKADAFRIGCLVTWTGLIEAGLPNWFDCLRLAGRDVGGVQIQNRGTLVGNICNASPAADGIPALLALDAEVELRSAGGHRTVPLEEFVLGNRRTVRHADELVAAILIPKRGSGARSTFSKLGARRYLVISIAMVAALVETDSSGRIGHARVAVGACSEVARRLPELETAITGRSIEEPLDAHVDEAMFSALSPIDDVRGSGEFRRAAALVLVRRALAALRADRKAAA